MLEVLVMFIDAVLVQDGLHSSVATEGVNSACLWIIKALR